MSPKAEVEIVEGDVAVVRCSGRITLGAGSGALRNAIQESLAGRHSKIVVDFGDVPYVDSSGFGELVRGYTDAMNAGGRLVLARPAQRIKDALHHTRLSRVFRSFESVEEAAAHLKGGR